MAVIKRCNSLERIPSERFLAAEFNVSRYLLRQCLAELARENIIKKGKRKQGNMMIGLHPWRRRVGIVIADGINSPYIDYPKVFNGIMNFFDHNEDYLPQIINFRTVEELVIKMDRYELDSIVWIVSSHNHIAPIDALSIEKKKKIVLITNNTFNQELKCNSISINFEKLFDRIVDDLIKKGMRRFIYIALKSKYRDRLIAKLKIHNIKWDDSMQISEFSEISERLPYLIDKYSPDAIICDGAFGFYESLFRTIAQQSKPYPLISANDNWRMRKYLSMFPTLHKMRFQCYDLSTARFQSGITAMEMLDRALAEDRLQEHKYLQVEPYFTSADLLLKRHSKETNK